MSTPARTDVPGSRHKKGGASPAPQTARSTAPKRPGSPPSPRPRGPQRTDVITAFLKKAYAELHPTGVLLSSTSSA